MNFSIIILLIFHMQATIKPNYGTDRLVFQKIHFTVRKRVRFGQALFVCGSEPEIGFWRPENALKLKWNQGDIWTGTLLITSQIPQFIQYKYIVANWNEPSIFQCQWEVGDHNRKIDLKRSKPLIFIDDRWNMDQISLYLIAKRSKSPQSERYYVTGSISQLGEWKDRKLMKKNLNSYISHHLNCQQQENLLVKWNKDYQILTFSFEIFRLQTQFCYYYMRKSDFTEIERKPGRIFKFSNQGAQYPCRKEVLHPRGDIVIIDQSSINQLKLSKVTSKIFVGSYPKTVADIQKLKQLNINTILSIQSQKDYQKNGVSPHYLQILCKENNINLKRCSIQDMNNKDFVAHAEDGVRIMKEVLKEGNQKIYVHCTAGIYRSPQMIALYLTACKKFKLQEAISLLKQKHSYSKPNFRAIQEALKVISEKNQFEQLRA